MSISLLVCRFVDGWFVGVVGIDRWLEVAIKAILE